jgi:hypothetical protein
MPRDDLAVKAYREGPNFRRQLLEEFAGLSWTNTLFFGCPILERIDRREFEFETAARFVEVRTSENGYVVSAPRQIPRPAEKRQGVPHGSNRGDENVHRFFLKIGATTGVLGAAVVPDCDSFANSSSSSCMIVRSCASEGSGRKSVITCNSGFTLGYPVGGETV